jgi:hypothetical protein
MQGSCLICLDEQVALQKAKRDFLHVGEVSLSRCKTSGATSSFGWPKTTLPQFINQLLGFMNAKCQHWLNTGCMHRIAFFHHDWQCNGVALANGSLAHVD